MRKLTWGALALALTGAAAAQVDGQMRLQWEQRQPGAAGPLALANTLAPGTVATPGDGATLEAELRSAGRGWSASATLQQQSQPGGGSPARGWFNELALSADLGPWQFSAGRKIVSWDVGYAFRPNDLVQQEQRRALVSTLAQGRPLLLAERFGADSAWSWVWVNPTQEHDRRGPQESAWAARWYQRSGSIDWHGFARYGAHTGLSAGAATAWVASDALELHASARFLQRADSLASGAGPSTLSRTNPWVASSVQHPAQALAGASWTGASRVSLLAEAWWDGTALSDAQWRDWGARNAALAALSGPAAPAGAVAGNLAWQADAFQASPSLRRANLYLRLSRDLDAWQPSLDLLWQGADGGRVLTAALLWKGDRVQWQGGARVYGGPAGALLAQLPTRRQATLTGTLAF